MRFQCPAIPGVQPLAFAIDLGFIASNGEKQTVRVHARLRVDTGSTLRVLLESGAGIAALDSLSTADPLKAGRLQRVLMRWSLADGGIYAVYPPGRHVAPATRAFVEFYRKALRAPQFERDCVTVFLPSRCKPPPIPSGLGTPASPEPASS